MTTEILKKIVETNLNAAHELKQRQCNAAHDQTNKSHLPNRKTSGRVPNQKLYCNHKETKSNSIL